jgi:hypothetical protein
VCPDSCCPQVLENNYRYKMKYSPDYVNVDTEAVRTLHKFHVVHRMYLNMHKKGGELLETIRRL